MKRYFKMRRNLKPNNKYFIFFDVKNNDFEKITKENEIKTN